MYIEREIWKGRKVVGEKSLKIILNRSISSKEHYGDGVSLREVNLS